MKAEKYIIALSLIAICILSRAQDIHFSQTDATPLLNNPALTGLFKGNHRAILNYKEQWKNVAYPYKTFALQYDANFGKLKLGNKDKLGIGAAVYSDKAGEANMGITQANLMAAYYKMFNNSHAVSIGFQGGFTQHSYNPANLTWDNQYQFDLGYNPNLPSNEPQTESSQFSFFDGATGIAYEYRKDKYLGTNVGIALHHVQSTDLKYYGLNDQTLYRRITAHGVMEKKIKNSETTFYPAFIYRKQNKSQEFVYGCMIKYQLDEKKFQGNILETAINFGVYNRYGDAVIFVSRFSYMHYTIGVSYDVTVSKLSEANKYKGGLEFSLIYITPYERRNKGSSLL